LPNLEGLDKLARRNGVDIRPTLVRVLTDLYVQKPLHTSEEEQHYTELTLRLIESVDVPTRGVVARKLASYASAPAKVVCYLARDVPEVAEPLLLHSPCLSSIQLLEIIGDLGPRYAAIIARRQPFKATAPQDHPLPAPVAEPPPPVSSETNARPAWADEAPAPKPAGDSQLGEVFLAADREQRRIILTNLGTGEQGQLPPPSWQEGAPGTVRRLEAHAISHRPDMFAAELEIALGISGELARRIVVDDSGEPLLVVVKALGMPSPVMLRVLLFLDPALGQSVDRVFDLARLYEKIAQEAAVRVVNSLREAVLVTRKAPPHQPVHIIEEMERIGRGSADAARRPVGTAGLPPYERRESAGAARVTEPRDRASVRRGDPRLR
jgi:hypothetical protein